MKTALRITSAADGGYVAGQRFYAYYPDFQGNVHVVASDGEFLQSNHYYPYGLPFAEGVAPKFQPHKYSGKEFLSDRSLNLYDFHARLQDPIIGGFDRMDNLMEEKPHISPYIYCMGNPIRFIDPSGNDEWDIDQNGRVVNYRKTDGDDVINIYNNYGLLDEIFLKKGTIKSVKETEDAPNYLLIQVSNAKDAKDLFMSICFFTLVEWSLAIGSDSDGNSYNYITSSHKDTEEAGLDNIVEKTKNKATYSELTHFHPEGSVSPSGLKDNTADIKFANKYKQIFPSVKCQIFIYFRNNKGDRFPEFIDFTDRRDELYYDELSNRFKIKYNTK